MKAKVREKERVVHLRKKGWSYRDIQNEVPVAKSTISNWLKDLPLSQEEKACLKRRTNSNISRGRAKAAAALTRNRLEREAGIKREAEYEFNVHKHNPFFQVGLALYWAEGAKRDSVCSLINSDPEMVSLFVSWLEQFGGVSRETLHARLFIHKQYAHENPERFWAEKLLIPEKLFKRTVYKASNSTVKKRSQYMGCLRVGVPKSKGLLIKMKMWQNMLVKLHK